ncbi:hypothetical protein [Tunturiibacter psychrotolerans]|jgi:hypothetical protein|uniref:hypothetical protein n=1 Tax=Tunturiibacter psychrotolerans TaxID=3069686 RepID=UPI003D1A0E83
MTLRPPALCELLCLALLRGASLLVPGRQREEWWREWRAELWHVRRAYTAEHSCSWIAEREVATFCLGAIPDALCFREQFKKRSIRLATTMGSATQCVQVLFGLIAISYGVAMLLPDVSAILHFLAYRDTRNLMLLRDAHFSDDSVATISVEQYRVWKRRRQELFNGFAFYQVAEQSLSIESRAATKGAVASASSNLFDLLGLRVRYAREAPGSLPRLILSEQMWKRRFGGDPHIFGRLIQVGSESATVSGVIDPGEWRLPGQTDAWLLLPEDHDGFSGGLGFVVAHLQTPHASWGEAWHMSAPTPAGTADDFFCQSLTERTRGPGDVFLFAVLLACLALPATTSLPLGEYRASSRRLSWFTRVRRWGFLGCKLTLLLPIVYFVSLDLAHLRSGMDPVTSEYIQLMSAFSLCLFGLRWSLRDQRQRCPVCLGKLTNPARVGQPSRSFLAWNGTELICISGHGLLHVPEMATSWFSEQRWLYLDASWEILFTEPAFETPGYF